MRSIETPQFLSFNEMWIDKDSTTIANRLTVTAAYSHDEDRYIASSVEVSNPMAPVKAADLRSLGLRKMMDRQLREELKKANPELLDRAAVKAFLNSKKGRPIAKKNHRKPTSQQIEDAEIVFRLARMTGAFTVISLAQSFGISYVDARRWADRIRRRMV